MTSNDFNIISKYTIITKQQFENGCPISIHINDKTIYIVYDNDKLLIASTNSNSAEKSYAGDASFIDPYTISYHQLESTIETIKLNNIITKMMYYNDIEKLTKIMVEWHKSGTY